MATPHKFADRAGALEFLFGRINYERSVVMPYQDRELKLDRMRHLLTLVDNPQLNYCIVHVAGTKGKGSTSAMISQILAEAGYRVGTYTSPHLERVEERIAVDGQPCDSSDLVACLSAIHPAVCQMDTEAVEPEHGPTYFEILTAVAMQYFAQQQVDIAVLEVGLGGRLDSTNVCQPEVCVITSISLDHTKQLGETLAEIAAEKAGIVKPGIPLISGVVTPEPEGVIRNLAQQNKAPYFLLGRDFDCRFYGLRIDGIGEPEDTRTSCQSPPQPYSELDFVDLLSDGSASIENLSVSLLGRHQAANAAVAVATVLQLVDGGWDVPEAAIRRALAKTHLPARSEILSQRPLVIIDGAHNVAAIEALLEVLGHFPHDRKHRQLVFSTSEDKDAAGMLTRLLPHFGCAYLTQYVTNPRAMTPDQLLEIAKGIAGSSIGEPTQLVVAEDPTAAANSVLAGSGPQNLICVTGSFFLVGELRERMLRGSSTTPQKRSAL